MRPVVLVLGAIASISCTSIFGEYTVLEGGPEACTTETEREDCPDDHECDADYSGDGVCRLTCSETNPCPKWRECSGNFCSEEVGTPCIDAYSDCGSAGSCITKDLDGESESQPYCSTSCDSADGEQACPPGYSCVDSLCQDVD